MTAFYIIITHLSPRITSQIRTIPCFAPPHLPPLSKVRCCRPKKFGRLPEGLPHHHPSLAPTLPKPHYPLLCTITLASLVKGEVLSPEKIRATTGGIVTPPTFPKPHYLSLFVGEELAPPVASTLSVSTTFAK